ncbi:MAG TPA: 3-oxoacyl-[acyl-carrier-protein] reductase [Flavobacteriales bacterium]|jgi:3-oxoacyl-[acyl-carrier protein] reductase|nr:3-oxoacyl-[acyl-carrier-protein] reductase [Flavobacteriales bacterium]
MDRLKDLNVVITGAARGIGRVIALLFAEYGANVAFTGRKIDDNFTSLEEELKAFGVKAKGYVSDASDYEAAQKTAADIVKEFGSIDVLVNNAGITRDNLLMRMNEKDWDDIMNVNLKSVFNWTKAVTRPMMKARKGSIINMSSVVGTGGNAGQANYAASKAGIIGFTKSVAKELGSRNIRCNAIAPGFIETEMTKELPEKVIEEWLAKIPLKRTGKPEDVANACLFLASDLSSYITGQVLTVDGGMTI